MTKYYGNIGFADTVDVGHGVWVAQVIERPYYGDILRNSRQLRNEPEKLNDNIKVSNKISIVADPYALSHFFDMKYIQWMGTRWKVTDVEVQHPRLILTVGEVYHGETPGP